MQTKENKQQKADSGRYKKLTILHSNDLHGDFLAEEVDDKLVGGVSMLSGYVNQVRKEEPNTLYMISGDMFRGSRIDSEFKGVSTIEIMNAIAPDVATLGNHELDYGIAHLLFLEKCCKFPIVNANVYLKTMGVRLFKSHQIFEIGGMKILVCGIITADVVDQAAIDQLFGTFVDVNEAAKEIGTICNSYKNVDIDLTVILTHIGFANDVELAKKLKPEWGVDVIIGGHSHTLLEKPEIVNDILIVQAGIGTDQIGRFDLVVDTDTNTVHDYKWQHIPIDADHCKRNEAIDQLIKKYKDVTDSKYGAVLATISDKASHPSRYIETTVGDLFCDSVKENYGLDLVLLGSGSFRRPNFGPVITKGDLMDMFPFEAKLIVFDLTGEEIKHAMKTMLKNALVVDEGGESEYYQISDGFSFEYDPEEDKLIKAEYLGKPIDDKQVFRVATSDYHANNLKKFLDLDEDTIKARKEWKVATSNIADFMEEYLKTHNLTTPAVSGRTKTIKKNK